MNAQGACRTMEQEGREMTYTVEQLREAIRQLKSMPAGSGCFIEYHELAKLKESHADALEGLARVKAPADGEIAEVVKRIGILREALLDEGDEPSMVATLDAARWAIESLAAKVAEYESTDLCGPGGPCKALASSYAALAERDAELANERKRHDQTAKEGMDERDERKRLEADLAKLKGHAEAMAKGMLDDGPANLWAAYDAYRAEFKEES